MGTWPSWCLGWGGKSPESCWELGWDHPCGGGQGMGCCGVPAMPSRRQRASWGAQEVPQLEMGFSWCRWRWRGMQGIPGEMNQRVNPQPGAQRQLPVRFISLCINEGKAPGAFLLSQPQQGKLSLEKWGRGLPWLLSPWDLLVSPQLRLCQCPAHSSARAAGTWKEGSSQPCIPASITLSWLETRDQLVRRMRDELWLPAA